MSITDINKNRLCQQLASDFKLEQFEDFHTFFVPSQTRGFSRIKTELETLVHRIAHLIFTGIWINESEVGKKINEYRYTRSLSDREEEKISQAFTSILGEGLYPVFFDSAMKESWYDKFSNEISFLANFIKHPLTTGAILPSSQFLAQKVSEHIVSGSSLQRSKKFLEVGAGTGEFTYQIIQKLGSQDKLDVVEFDEDFCKILRNRFGHLKNVSINLVSILDWKTDGYKYDAIVSGLPLNAFKAEMVREVYKKFNELINEEGYLSYFEYPYISELKKTFLPREDQEELEKVFEIKENFCKLYQESSKIEWLNVPPAKAIHCKVSTPKIIVQNQ